MWPEAGSTQHSGHDKALRLIVFEKLIPIIETKLLEQTLLTLLFGNVRPSTIAIALIGAVQKRRGLVHNIGVIQRE